MSFAGCCHRHAFIRLSRWQQSFCYQRRKVLGSGLTVFPQPQQGGPVLWMKHGIGKKSAHAHLAIVCKKGIEVRQPVSITVGDGLETVEGDIHLLGNTGDGGGLHVYQRGLEALCEAALLMGTDDAVCAEKTLAMRGVGREAVVRAGIDYLSDDVC